MNHFISRTILVALLAVGSGGTSASGQAAIDPAIQQTGVKPSIFKRGVDVGYPVSPNKSGATTAARSSGKTLKYYGGPVLKNAKFVKVLWNGSVQNSSGLDAFFKGILGSGWGSFFSQYSTTSPVQAIGLGSYLSSLTSNQTYTNVSDSQIMSFISAQISAGTLPAPDANTVYAVFFPAGVKITASDGSQSCVQFCAYHGTFVRNNLNIYYDVMPDLSQSGCSGGCGSSTVLNNTTSVLSHEMAETITDPAVGLATVYGPPLGWYNATYGEIGDICNGQQATVTGTDGHTYTVQKLWSNTANACVAP